MSGLRPTQKYLYRVCAENAAGVSDPAQQLGPLLADDPHGTQHQSGKRTLTQDKGERQARKKSFVSSSKAVSHMNKDRILNMARETYVIDYRYYFIL